MDLEWGFCLLREIEFCVTNCLRGKILSPFTWPGIPEPPHEIAPALVDSASGFRPEDVAGPGFLLFHVSENSEGSR